ncbi:MAG: SCP2 sterol-binding domain-containing protein [Candidatus Thorarchaeota archaeon]
MLNRPKDLLGNILDILLARQFEDEAFLSQVKSWKMSVVLDTDYYPVTLKFHEGISIEKGAISNPTITLTTTIATIASIAEGRLSPVQGMLTRRLKLRGLLTHPRATYRFYRLMMRALGG